MDSQTMQSSSFKALMALLGAGALLGIATNFAKLAGDLGLPPIAFLAWSLFGAALILLATSVVRGVSPPLTRPAVEYYIFAALLSTVGSNIIVVTATPEVGAGFVSLAITLPPILTYVGALFFRLEGFSLLRFIGVLLALSGAALVALGKLEDPDANVFWIGLALLVPLILAAGNLYRTLRWPEGTSADALAPGMLVTATMMVFIFGALTPYELLPKGADLPQIGLILAQSAVFAGQFLLLFVLQKAGGPVFLSLLGAVGALVGVPIAVLLLSESIPTNLLPASGLILAGIIALSWTNTARKDKVDDG